MHTPSRVEYLEKLIETNKTPLVLIRNLLIVIYPEDVTQMRDEILVKIKKLICIFIYKKKKNNSSLKTKRM